MPAIALALTAALAWGVADYGAGHMSRRIPVVVVLCVMEACGLAVSLTIALGTAAEFPDHAGALLAMAAGVAGAAALGVFYQALAIGRMSIVAPLSASGIALPCVVGLSGGEPLSPLVASGLVAVVLGIVLVSLSEAAPHDAADERRRLSIVLALVAALGFGGYYVASDPAADSSVVWTLVLSRCVVLPVLLVFAVRAMRDEAARPGRSTGAVLALLGLLDLVATAALASANTIGDVAVVSCVAALYPAVTVGLAWSAERDRLRLREIAGIGAALLGVVLLSAG